MHAQRHEEEQRRVAGVLDGAARVGRRNRQRHEQQQARQHEQGEEVEQTAGHTSVYFAHEHPPVGNRGAHHRRAHRKADHHARSVPAVAQCADQRLQPEEQPGTFHAARRTHREVRRRRTGDAATWSWRNPDSAAACRSISRSSAIPSSAASSSRRRKPRSCASCCCAGRRRRVNCAAACRAWPSCRTPASSRSLLEGLANRPGGGTGRAAAARSRIDATRAGRSCSKNCRTSSPPWRAPTTSRRNSDAAASARAEQCRAGRARRGARRRGGRLARRTRRAQAGSRRMNLPAWAQSAGSAGRVERLHDVRVVRAPQEHGGEAVGHRRARELGHRAVRIPGAGARESHRLHHDVAGPAQGHAGSHHARGVRAVRDSST